MDTGLMRKKIVGFTLAEVLLTLAIVGIVAALTIPSVISSTQKQQWVTGLQKSVAMLDQMVKQLNVDNGCSSFDCVIGGITTSSYPAKNNQFADIIKQRLNYTKLCYGGEPFGDICYPSSWKDLGGTAESGWANHAKFLMSDGSCIAFYLNNPNCDSNHVIINGENVHCAYAEVDINCLKGPNQRGRDMFQIQLHKYGAIPRGSELSTYKYSENPEACDPSNSTSGGWLCGGRIMLEGWKMTY